MQNPIWPILAHEYDDPEHECHDLAHDHDKQERDCLVRGHDCNVPAHDYADLAQDLACDRPDLGDQRAGSAKSSSTLIRIAAIEIGGDLAFRRTGDAVPAGDCKM